MWILVYNNIAMTTANILGLLTLIAFITLIVSIIIYAHDSEKENEEMENELKAIEEKYQDDIDNMWAVYWYEQQKMHARTAWELEFLEQQSNKAAKIFLDACIKKAKEEKAIYKKYWLEYPYDK